MPSLLGLAAFAALLLAPSAPAPANFVYDLSSRLIAITTAFVGTQVLLYGAVQESATEIAVVIRGPARDTTVRRKTRVGPIWINTQSLTFRAVPSFYMVAASIEGESIIHNADPIKRAHPRFVENLQSLGADVRWVSD